MGAQACTAHESMCYAGSYLFQRSHCSTYYSPTGACILHASLTPNRCCVPPVSKGDATNIISVCMPFAIIVRTAIFDLAVGFRPPENCGPHNELSTHASRHHCVDRNFRRLILLAVTLRPSLESVQCPKSRSSRLGRDAQAANEIGKLFCDTDLMLWHLRLLISWFL